LKTDLRTTRDRQIVEFIDDYKVATTSTIAELFFPSVEACYKRLQVLNANNQIKRIRDSINNEYIYYKKLPKQIKHSLMVSNFYRELHKLAEVANFKIEPDMGEIQPDAVFGYKYRGKNYLGLLEVEISHKGFNYAKYEKFYSSGSYQKYLMVMPTIFVVGDSVKLPDRTNIKYLVIKTDFSNLKAIL
jgi:hypothetical protein